MKRSIFQILVAGSAIATIGPAFAGDSGSLDSSMSLLVQALGHLAAKLLGLG